MSLLSDCANELAEVRHRGEKWEETAELSAAKNVQQQEIIEDLRRENRELMSVIDTYRDEDQRWRRILQQNGDSLRAAQQEMHKAQQERDLLREIFQQALVKSRELCVPQRGNDGLQSPAAG